MSKLLLVCVILGLGTIAFILPGSRTVPDAAAAQTANQLLSHDVYFTLKDKSPAAKKKLVDACKKYLSQHPGTVFFAAGTLVEDLKREVNDRDFDVALHIVFRSKADHDKYQDAALHLQFIEENRANWSKVRVFDSFVEQ